MANTITGRILSISPTLYITTKKGDNLPKRIVVIDCTRFDPWTGEKQGFENTPEFDFFGDSCSQLDQYKLGDVVTIYFDVQGSRYTSRDGVEKIFTRVKPYRIESYETAARVSPSAAPAQQVSFEIETGDTSFVNPVVSPSDKDGLPF